MGASLKSGIALRVVYRIPALTLRLTGLWAGLMQRPTAGRFIRR